LVSKVIGLRSIHSINIQKDTNQFGNITLVSTSKTKVVQKEVIEQFVFLVSIFIEKQLASKRLKQQEENFREIIESSKDVHYKQDFNSGRFLYIAPSIENILGYPVSEVLEMDLERQKLLFHEDDFQRIRNFPNQLVEANKNGISFIELEFRMYTKSREIVWIHGTYSLKTDEKDNPCFIIGLLRDVTDSKAFETELLKAKEKAEESDRLKSAFLANLSHEIRTPMNGIIGFTELLQRHEFSPEDNDRFLSVISQSSERMLNIINDLIDISIIESGQMKVDITPVHINQILDSAFHFFDQKATKKGLQLQKTKGLNATEDVILTDGNKLYAVLSNLINNAIKFTKSGKIRFGYTKSGNYLLFSVEDTGIGMDDETQAFVFDRFRQAEISSSRTYEGAGLGLSIARSYVEMLGGKIRVESQKGKGSVFYFTLPFNNITAGSTILKPEPMESDASFHGKIKVLIAEDNEESDLLLSTILEDISEEILHTDSGLAVVDICRDHPDIDLILMDIKLHGQSGIDATKQIRSFNKKVVIIAQTAYAQQGDSEKIRLAGCNGYLSKPILKKSLMDEINKHFN
jgi:PAS domain S-box-containing protein